VIERDDQGRGGPVQIDPEVRADYRDLIEPKVAAKLRR